MSGGFFEYKDFMIEEWVEDIEEEVFFHAVAKAVKEGTKIPKFPYQKKANDDEKNIYDDPNGYTYLYRKFLDIVEGKDNHWINIWSDETFKKIKKYIKLLKKCKIFLHEFDWFISGDTGEDTFLKRLKKERV